VHIKFIMFECRSTDFPVDSQFDFNEKDDSIQIAIEFASVAIKRGPVYLCSLLTYFIRENRQ